MDNPQKIIETQITEKAIAEIVRKCANKPSPPDTEESLFDSGYLDSFALADVVAELESAFAIRIPDSDVNPRRFETIEKISALLQTKAAGSAG